MRHDISPPQDAGLTPKQQTHWQADVAALRDHRCREAQFPLRLGDLINEMEGRWEEKLPLVAQAAGVSYRTAKQRARIAALVPPGSRLRTLGLPYGILCLLADVPEPEPWAERALALQEAGTLRVRGFARLLEEGGVRQPRARRRLRCLSCDRELGEEPSRFYLRAAGRGGWLCGSACLHDYAEEAELSWPAAGATGTTEVRAAPLPEPPAPMAPPEPEATSPPSAADTREAEDDAPVTKPRGAPKEHGRAHAAGRRGRGKGGRSTGSHRRPRSPAASRLKGRGRPMARGCARRSPGVKQRRGPPNLRDGAVSRCPH